MNIVLRMRKDTTVKATKDHKSSKPRYAIYPNEYLERRYHRFRERYPTPSDSELISAALMFYLDFAERTGIDGNLVPLANTPEALLNYELLHHASDIGEKVR